MTISPMSGILKGNDSITLMIAFAPRAPEIYDVKLKIDVYPIGGKAQRVCTMHAIIPSQTHTFHILPIFLSQTTFLMSSICPFLFAHIFCLRSTPIQVLAQIGESHKGPKVPIWERVQWKSHLDRQYIVRRRVWGPTVCSVLQRVLQQWRCMCDMQWLRGFLDSANCLLGRRNCARHNVGRVHR